MVCKEELPLCRPLGKVATSVCKACPVKCLQLLRIPYICDTCLEKSCLGLRT